MILILPKSIELLLTRDSVICFISLNINTEKDNESITRIIPLSFLGLSVI